MKTEEMNKGVQILLERMQSNPEEFIQDWRGEFPPKWRAKLDAVTRRASYISNKKKDPDYYPELPFLKDEEILALYYAMENLLANKFTEDIMATLLRDAELPSEELSFTSRKAIGGTQKSQSAYAISASQAKWLETLDPYEKQHALEMLREYAKQQAPVTFKTKARQVFK